MDKAITVKSRAGELRVTEIASHRNGIDGAPFYVVLFYWDDEHMIATVFDDEEAIAVLNRADVASGEIAYGIGSYKGCDYEKGLREAIAQYEEDRRPKDEREHSSAQAG
jgi:hypothetical protein